MSDCGEPASSSPVALRPHASTRSLRSLLDVSGITSRSAVSLDDLSEVDDTARSGSVDDFSRLVGEISMSKRLQARSSSSLRKIRSMRSIHSIRSAASSDDARSRDDDAPRRLCCCDKPECDVARRTARQWMDMESDLQLSAEIGQALLRRQDTILYHSQQEADEHTQQRDLLLARLSGVIKENQALERQLAQANFNLESADHSHRALLSELDEARRQTRQERTATTKARALEARLERAYADLHEMRDELHTERVRGAQERARHRAALSRASEGEEHEHSRARAHMQRLLDASPDEPEINEFVREYDALRDDDVPVRRTSYTGSDRAAGSGSSRSIFSEAAFTSTDITTPSEREARPSETFSVGSEHERYDARTALLPALVDWVHRTANKLRAADVDTLTQRLTRQKLAGDVVHLSRATVNGLLRDIEGFREHFRREIEREAKLDLPRDPDESLVLRRDFFALLKLFRELLVEITRLRLCVNEVQMAPNDAARLLQQHLGADMSAHLARGSWFSRMFALGSSAEPRDAPQESAFARIIGAPPPPPPAAQPARIQRKRSSAPRLVPRSSAAVMSSSVAVHVRGSQTAAVGGGLAHARLPSYASGLYASGEDRPVYRSMRIQDDDQVSVRRGAPEQKLRTKGLSDSSIRSTFIEHGEDAPVDRIITAESLAAHVDS